MKDRKNLKLPASILIVIVVSALILNSISVLVEDKFSNTIYLDRQNVEEFYSLKKNTVDVLTLGTSQVLADFASPELYINYGISSFGLATCNQPLFATYYWLLEALETQSPKVVLLEMSALYGSSETQESSFFKAISTMKNTSINKFRAVNEIAKIFKGTDKLSYYSNLYKFHSRWEEISKADYNFLRSLEQPTYGGAAVINKITNSKLDINAYYVEMPDNEPDIENDESKVLYIKKIADLCREKGIKLVLFKTPKETWKNEYYACVSQYANALGVEYIDLNIKEALDTIGFDFNTDFTDRNHLNATGAQKLTNYLGKYLSENYELPDHRGDKKYKSYDKTAQEYAQAFNSAIIARSKDLAEILSLAKDKNYSILIAKGGNVDSAKIDKQIQDLGGSPGSLSDGKNVLLSFENGKLIKKVASGKSITLSKYYSNRINYQIYHSGKKTVLSIFGKSCTVNGVEDYVAICIYDNIANYTVYSGAFHADLSKIN